MTDVIRKQLTSEVKGVDEDTREMTFVMSSAAVDRDGDIIEADGWRLENFQKNPVFLLFHDQRQFPIGRVNRIWVENNKLMGRVRFADKGTYDMADVAYELYKQGIMNAVSVSFAGTKYEPMEEGGIKFLEQELYELSAVPVPANPEAVAVARKAYLGDAQPDAIAQAEATETEDDDTEAGEILAALIDLTNQLNI